MISSSELEEYFARNGVQTPDIENTRLGTIIDGILASPVLATRQQLQEALSTTALWVCQCQRIFSKISTGRLPFTCTALPPKGTKPRH